MLSSFLTKVFGSKNERELKKLQPIIEQINALETDLKVMSDDRLKGHTAKFKERLNNGEPLDDLLPEAFAVVRRRRGAPSTCATSMCSCLAASFYIRARSPK